MLTCSAPTSGTPAQLADSLYLTQLQVERADDDQATTLSGAIQRPGPGALADWREPLR